MPQLLERKRDRQAHIRMSIAYRVFLWGNYSITKPLTVCSNMSKNAPHDKIQSPCRFIDLFKTSSLNHSASDCFLRHFVHSSCYNLFIL